MNVFLKIHLLLMSIRIPGLRSGFVDQQSQKGYLNIKHAVRGLVKRHKLSISRVNIFGNRLIAMDRKNSKLLFVVYKNGIIWEKCFNLGDIMFCRIAKNFNTENGYVRKVNLELSLPPGEIISFSFFDDEDDDGRYLPGRIKKAQFWKSKILLTRLYFTGTRGI